jgi:hypothetical protein
MHLLLIFITTFLLSCAHQKLNIIKPFGYKTKWLVGSPLSHMTSDDSVEIIFPANKFGPNESGFNWAADLTPKDEYSISYEVNFADDFDFVSGGKLPGLCGGHGKAGEKPKGDEKFSARIMWRRNGKVVSYVYHLDQIGNYGDDFTWTNNGTLLQFPTSKWNKIKFTVKLNSEGKQDGSIIGYFNDQLSIEKHRLRFRESSALKIDKLCFNTFFGGNDQSWAPKSQQKIIIRNLRVE